jgi:tetratricopeptide (TPR) repeat protein
MGKMRTEFTAKIYDIMDREMKELGPFIVKKQCLLIHVDPENIQPQDLPQLASKLAEAMVMFAGHEKANRIYSEIRKLRNLDLIAKEERSEGTKLKMLEELGKGSLYAGEWAKALAYFDELLKDAEGRGDAVAKTRYLKLCGEVHKEMAEFDRALSCFEQALKVAQSLANKVELSNCHNAMGDALWYKGDLRKAMDSYKLAADEAESAGYKAGVGVAHIGLGNVLADKHDLDDSIESYITALAHLKYTEEFQQIARAYNNLGDTYMMKEAWDKALECFTRSEEFAEKGGWLNMTAWAQFNSGMALVEKGRHDEAEALLRKSAGTLERLGDRCGMAGVHHAYAKLYRATGKPEEMAKHFAEAIKRYSELKMPLNEAECRYGLGIGYRALGKKEKALRELRTAAVLYSDLKLDKRVKKVVREIEAIQ